MAACVFQAAVVDGNCNDAHVVIPGQRSRMQSGEAQTRDPAHPCEARNISRTITPGFLGPGARYRPAGMTR